MLDASRPAYHARRSRLTTWRLASLSLIGLFLACEPEVPEPSSEPGFPRIVSIGADLAALLVELGLGPAVVGADSASLAIPELAHALDLGDATAPSLELARGLHAELVLVLAAAAQPAAGFAESLRADGIPTRVLAPRDANDVLAAIHLVGRAVDRELRATTVAARLTQDVSGIATLRDGRSRARVVWVLQREPLVVVGGLGLLHELLELAGAENAFHSQTPLQERVAITSAQLAASAPDIVIDSLPGSTPLVGAARIAIDPALAALPTLNVAARVRALHEALYPGQAPTGAPTPTPLPREHSEATPR